MDLSQLKSANQCAKVFGNIGWPKPLSHKVKKALMAKARAMVRPTEPGKHYGDVTAKHCRVYEVLLWDFHNAATGLCFPSYEAIAEKAGCARSTVHLALKALDKAGLLKWVHRLKRVYANVVDMFGQITGGEIKVERTSNGYMFQVPPDISESELPSGTPVQASFPSLLAAPQPKKEPEPALAAALARLGKACGAA
jgi:hypothetical protein